MALDPRLTEVLACPRDDHGALREDTRDGAPVLVCRSCGTGFRIDGDIPVLLIDEALPPVEPAPEPPA